MKHLRIALCLALAGLPLLADWTDYKEITLREAWERTIPVTKNVSYVGIPQAYKFLIKGEFTGGIRKISSERLKFIANWGKGMGTPDYTARYATEVEIRAQGLSTWVPIQENLMREFKDEVKLNAETKFYMMYIGAMGEDRVFLVNEFDAD